MIPKKETDSVTNRFLWLQGRWRLERTISDGSHAVGTAQIERVDACALRLREEAALTLPSGETLNGGRTYLLEAGDHSLIVRFADGPSSGAIFQTFSLAQPTSSSTHLCGEDVYRSTFTWLSEDHFEMVHAVSGPRKNYVMSSSYLRAAKSETL